MGWTPLRAATGIARSARAGAAQRWLEARQADLLPVEYYHVVFTLPAPIADIAYQNKAAIYGLLFDVAAETLLTIAADPKHLGARIGATLVLHTWGSALTHHPHVHGIVPGGGLSPDGERWVACRPGFFLPVRVLSRLFRRRFLEELAAGCIAPAGCSSSASTPRWPMRTAFAAWLAPLRQCEWVVYAKRPFAGPAAVLAYLSRYTHRVAISNSRLARHGRARRHLPLEGLPRQGPHAPQDHDARRRRVHAPLPAARAARRLPSHPPLRAARQRRRKANLARRARCWQRCAVAQKPPDTEHATSHRPFVCSRCGAPMLIVADIRCAGSRSAHHRRYGHHD